MVNGPSITARGTASNPPSLATPVMALSKQKMPTPRKSEISKMAAGHGTGKDARKVTPEPIAQLDMVQLQQDKLEDVPNLEGMVGYTPEVFAGIESVITQPSVPPVTPVIASSSTQPSVAASTPSLSPFTPRLAASSHTTLRSGSAPTLTVAPTTPFVADQNTVHTSEINGALSQFQYNRVPGPNLVNPERRTVILAVPTANPSEVPGYATPSADMDGIQEMPSSVSHYVPPSAVGRAPSTLVTMDLDEVAVAVAPQQSMVSLHCEPVSESMDTQETIYAPTEEGNRVQSTARMPSESVPELMDTQEHIGDPRAAEADVVMSSSAQHTVLEGVPMDQSHSAYDDVGMQELMDTQPMSTEQPPALVDVAVDVPLVCDNTQGEDVQVPASAPSANYTTFGDTQTLQTVPVALIQAVAQVHQAIGDASAVVQAQSPPAPSPAYTKHRTCSDEAEDHKFHPHHSTNKQQACHEDNDDLSSAYQSPALTRAYTPPRVIIPVDFLTHRNIETYDDEAEDDEAENDEAEGDEEPLHFILQQLTDVQMVEALAGMLARANLDQATDNTVQLVESLPSEEENEESAHQAVLGNVHDVSACEPTADLQGSAFLVDHALIRARHSETISIPLEDDEWRQQFVQEGEGTTASADGPILDVLAGPVFANPALKHPISSDALTLECQVVAGRDPASLYEDTDVLAQSATIAEQAMEHPLHSEPRAQSPESEGIPPFPVNGHPASDQSEVPVDREVESPSEPSTPTPITPAYTPPSKEWSSVPFWMMPAATTATRPRYSMPHHPYTRPESIPVAGIECSQPPITRPSVFAHPARDEVDMGLSTITEPGDVAGVCASIEPIIADAEVTHDTVEMGTNAPPHSSDSVGDDAGAGTTRDAVLPTEEHPQGPSADTTSLAENLPLSPDAVRLSALASSTTRPRKDAERGRQTGCKSSDSRTTKMRIYKTSKRDVQNVQTTSGSAGISSSSFSLPSIRTLPNVAHSDAATSRPPGRASVDGTRATKRFPERNVSVEEGLSGEGTPSHGDSGSDSNVSGDAPDVANEEWSFSWTDTTVVAFIAYHVAHAGVKSVGSAFAAVSS